VINETKESPDDVLQMIAAQPGWRGLFVSTDEKHELEELHVVAWATTRSDPTRVRALFADEHGPEADMQYRDDGNPGASEGDFVGLLAPGEVVDDNPKWEKRIEERIKIEQKLRAAKPA
jgi:hypothetical protein